jgi:uncharacterized glyoxalase superfamily protein PhnB
MKNVAGLVCYVKDTKKTARFYEALGFIFDKRESNHLSTKINKFLIDFHPQDKEDIPEFQQEAKFDNKGSGLFIYISIDNVDDFYQKIIAKGLKPSSKPRDYPWGNREFMIHDPDGYKLVFFKKNKM